MYKDSLSRQKLQDVFSVHPFMQSPRRESLDYSIYPIAKDNTWNGIALFGQL